MNEKILNEHLRMIYLTEDFKSVGLRLFSKLKNGNFSPEKAEHEEVPSIETVADFASKKIPTYDEAKKEVDSKGKKLDYLEKQVMTVTLAALKDLKDEPSLRDHVEDMLHELYKTMEFGAKAGAETTIFLTILHALMKHFRNGSFLTNILKTWAIKFGAATVLILIVYIVSKLGYEVVRKRGK